MRVMLVDPDEAFASDLSDHLTEAGFEVVCSASPDQMRAHMRSRDFQAVMVDLSLRRMNGFDVARELRMEYAASDLAILLMSPRHREDSPEIVSLKQDTESAHYFLKPVEYSSVVAALRVPLPAPKSRPPADPVPGSKVDGLQAPAKAKKPAPGRLKSQKPREIHWENLREIVDIWTQKQTGTLVVAGQQAGAAIIVDGGLVDDDAYRITKSALKGGVVAFKPGQHDVTGDWARMGRLLFKGARAGSDPRTLRRYFSAVPTANEFTSVARALPLGKESRGFVGRINGVLTVAEIVDAGGFPLGDISRDIMALVQMGLFVLRRADDESAPKTPVSDAQATSKLSGQDRRQVVDANAREEGEQILVRLQKEFATIKDALPPVVLGVPADADRSMVDAAGARMRQRYAGLIARTDVSDEVRKLALEIAKKVDSAYRNFNLDTDIQTGSGRRARMTAFDEVEDMLERARVLIDAKDWVGADQLLSKAHEKRIDHVPVLANLGWARLHNPEHSLEDRTEEGKDFLLLAEQFDPMDADGQYYMAQVLVASNRLDAAEERAKRAAEAMPQDAHRSALLRKIRVLRAQEQAKG